MTGQKTNEKLLLYITLGVVGLFVADRFLLTPGIAWVEDLGQQKATLESDVAQSKRLIEMKPTLDARWNKMQASNLSNTRSAAEGQIYESIQQWAEAAGLSVQSIRPQREIEDSVIPQLTFQASMTGEMKDIATFLKKLDTADIPIRVNQMTISSRKEGLDDIALDLRLSTLFGPAKTTGQGAAPRSNDSNGEPS